MVWSRSGDTFPPMAILRVTVCQLPNDPEILAGRWAELVTHVRGTESDLVLLPEMPFHPWLCGTDQVDAAAWSRAVAAHERGLERLAELGSPTVLTSRPVVDGGVRYNEAVVWRADHASWPGVHRKRYLPDEPGFYEATWYARGDRGFEHGTVSGVRIGFAICTEMWFFAHHRAYARAGLHVLACPRATYAGSADKWLAGGRAAAVVSGAFCLSSNFEGAATAGAWGGLGWVVEPEEGEVLATTSVEEPFATVAIDLEVADAAKRSYPRYVDDT